MRDLTENQLREALILANKVIRSVKCEPTMQGNKYFLMIPTYRIAMDKYQEYLQKCQSHDKTRI